MFHLEQLAAVTGNHGADFLFRRARQAAGFELRHVLNRQQFRNCAELLELPLVQDGDAITNVLNIRQQVAAHQDSLSLVPQLEDQVLHLAGTDGVEAGCGFVEQNQLRVVDQRLGQADAPRHAFGIFTQLAAASVLDSHQLNQALNPLLTNLRRHIEQSAVKVQRLFGIQEFVQVGLFRQIANAFVLGDIRRIFAKHQGLPAGGKQQPQQELDGGRFARPVGPQQAKNLPLADLQVQGVKSADLGPAPEVAKNLGQAARLNHHVPGGRSGFEGDGFFQLHGHKAENWGFDTSPTRRRGNQRGRLGGKPSLARRVSAGSICVPGER